MASNATRIMVVEDEPDVRMNLERWLAMSGYEVFAASNGTEAIALLKRQPIDVVVTDLQMPGLHGIDLLTLIKDLDPTIEVIILTGSATLEYAIEAVRARAFDFLQKPLVDLNRLNAAIEKALLQRHRGSLGSRTGRRSPASSLPGEELTRREREVLDQLLTGIDNREIAQALFLSEKTVRNLLSTIYSKLGVENRTQAVLLCQQQNLI